MSSTDERDEIIRTLARPFFETDGIEKVFVSECCSGIILVAPVPAVKCRTCGSVPRAEALYRDAFSS